MATKSVQTLLEDIRFMSEAMHDIVQAVRALVKTEFKASTEEVKYGGILLPRAYSLAEFLHTKNTYPLSLAAARKSLICSAI